MADNNNIRKDPFIVRLLSTMTTEVADSFSDEQLYYLKLASKNGGWGTHTVELRGSIGFWRLRYFYVLLARKEKRQLSDKQNGIFSRLELFTAAILLIIGTVGFVGIAGFTLYIVKSALGIDIIPFWSTGIWHYFTT